MTAEKDNSDTTVKLTWTCSINGLVIIFEIDAADNDLTPAHSVYDVTINDGTKD